MPVDCCCAGFIQAFALQLGQAGFRQVLRNNAKKYLGIFFESRVVIKNLIYLLLQELHMVVFGTVTVIYKQNISKKYLGCAVNLLK